MSEQNQEQDIRWQQRLGNFSKALMQLKSAVELQRQRKLSELECQGLIKSFEFTHELAWNVLKDFLEYQGSVGSNGIMGSRDATREAFGRGLIKDGDIWMEMIKSRNQTSHTYNQSVAEDIVKKVALYLDLFVQLEEKLSAILHGQVK